VSELVTKLSRGEVTRREFLARAVALGLSASALATLLAACGSEPDVTTSSSPNAMDTTLPESIALYNYSNYMDPSVLDEFSREYGVEVFTPFYDTNETALAKLKGVGGEGYDIVVPSDYMVSIMRETGLLQPLDMSLIPNFADVEPFLQQPAFDSGADGSKYSVPYMFGTSGVAVRADHFDGDVTAWSQLWDPANKGKIQMMDDVRQVMGAALMLLGYSINDTDEAHIAEAGDKLVEQKELVVRYNNAAMKRDILQPVAPLIHAFDGDAVGAARELPEGAVEYVLPQEGYNCWADNMCILAKSASPYAAHLLINFLLEKENAAACTDFIGYQTAVASAVPLISDETVKAMRPSSEQLAAGQFLEDVGEAARFYDAAWQRVKAAS
jgi:spermidine/putrescine transport system substrate-binding protein